MYRLSRVGQDMMGAALVLFACLGFGQPAFAAGPPALDNTIADFSRPEDSAPQVFDLQQSFRDGIGGLTYTVASSDSAIVDATNLTNGGRDLTLTYQPNASGSATITLTATDTTPDSVSYSFTVTVTPVNDPPVADSQAVAVGEDSAVAITLTASDPDGDTLTFIEGVPSNGTLTGTAPTLTYTPAPNFNGSDSFTFVVKDGTVTSAAATVSITVNTANDAPVASAQVLTTGEDTPLSITLSGTDADGDTLTFSTSTPDPAAR